MKLNRLRNYALGLIFLGFAIMYAGVFVDWLMPITFTLGSIAILISVGIYFRVGAMSMKIPTVVCPHCRRYTKVMGVEDGCMHCRTPIRLEMAEDESLYAVVDESKVQQQQS